MALLEDPMGRGDSGLQETFADLFPKGFSTTEIHDHWNQLLDHWRRLCGVLDRDPGLRVALVDFFQNRRQLLRNPVFMEGDWFERWSTSSRTGPDSECLTEAEFGRAVRVEVNRALRYGHEFSLLKLGPAEPDEGFTDDPSAEKVLPRLEEVVPKTVRSSDIAGRSGKEGVLLLLPGTERMGAHDLGERILRACAGPPSGTPPGTEYRSRVVRGGVAAFPEDGTTAGDLISRAEEAFSRAGIHGETGVGVFYRERRRGIRRPLSGIVFRMRAAGTEDFSEVPAEPRDFSLNGIFLETSVPCGIGQEIWLLPPLGIASPESGAIRARVVRRTEPQRRKFPYGLAVEIPVPDDRRRIAGWLRGAAEGSKGGNPS